MAAVTILFKKSKTLVEREIIVESFIKSCETSDFDKLRTLVKDESNFEAKDQNIFLAEMKSIFKGLSAKRIKQLTPDVSFCNLTFFKEEIVNFSCRSGKARFTLLFNTDEGFVKDITIRSNIA